MRAVGFLIPAPVSAAPLLAGPPHPSHAPQLARAPPRVGCNSKPRAAVGRSRLTAAEVASMEQPLQLTEQRAEALAPLGRAA